MLFIDRPTPDAPSGIWAVDLNGNPPQFVSDRLGIYTADLNKRAFLQNGVTTIEDLSSGERWPIANGGRAVSFSPDGEWLAWTSGQDGPPFDRAQREVWVSRIDGSEPQMAFAAEGGGFSGWFPDGRLLISRRLQAPEGGQVFWALSWNGDNAPELLELGRGGRLREPQISLDGNWLAYLATFSEDSNLDGLWIVNTMTGERRKLTVFGGYRWRDADRLFVIPMDLSEPNHRLVQVHADSGFVEPLVAPSDLEFKIAAGDWAVSPDGSRIVFVSANDRNLWLLYGNW